MPSPTRNSHKPWYTGPGPRKSWTYRANKASPATGRGKARRAAKRAAP